MSLIIFPLSSILILGDFMDYLLRHIRIEMTAFHRLYLVDKRQILVVSVSRSSVTGFETVFE